MTETPERRAARLATSRAWKKAKAQDPAYRESERQRFARHRRKHHERIAAQANEKNARNAAREKRLKPFDKTRSASGIHVITEMELRYDTTRWRRGDTRKAETLAKIADEFLAGRISAETAAHYADIALKGASPWPTKAKKLAETSTSTPPETRPTPSSSAPS